MGARIPKKGKSVTSSSKGKESEPSASVASSSKSKKSKPGASRLNPTNNSGTRIPPPQAERIIGKYISGQSIRSISREEDRDRETIARVVRSRPVQLFIANARRSYFGLADDAIGGMRKKLRKGTDSWLNRQFLLDIGAVPSPRELDLILVGDSQTGNRALEIIEQAADWVAEGENKEGDEGPDPPDDVNK